MGFSGLNPLGSMVTIAAEAPLHKAQQITKFAASKHARGAGAESRQRPQQDRAAAEARDIAALRREIERRALPVGPSPAFEMNLLEAEGGLDQVLARIEAARTRDRDAPALRPTAPEPAAQSRAATGSVMTSATAESPEAQPANAMAAPQAG